MGVLIVKSEVYVLISLNFGLNRFGNTTSQLEGEALKNCVCMAACTALVTAAVIECLRIDACARRASGW